MNVPKHPSDKPAPKTSPPPRRTRRLRALAVPLTAACLCSFLAATPATGQAPVTTDALGGDPPPSSSGLSPAGEGLGSDSSPLTSPNVSAAAAPSVVGEPKSSSGKGGKKRPNKKKKKTRVARTPRHDSAPKTPGSLPGGAPNVTLETADDCLHVAVDAERFDMGDGCATPPDSRPVEPASPGDDAASAEPKEGATAEGREAPAGADESANSAPSSRQETAPREGARPETGAEPEKPSETTSPSSPSEDTSTKDDTPSSETAPAPSRSSTPETATAREPSSSSADSAREGAGRTPDPASRAITPDNASPGPEAAKEPPAPPAGFPASPSGSARPDPKEVAVAFVRLAAADCAGRYPSGDELRGEPASPAANPQTTTTPPPGNASVPSPWLSFAKERAGELLGASDPSEEAAKAAEAAGRETKQPPLEDCANIREVLAPVGEARAVHDYVDWEPASADGPMDCAHAWSYPTEEAYKRSDRAEAEEFYMGPGCPENPSEDETPSEKRIDYALSLLKRQEHQLDRCVEADYIEGTDLKPTKRAAAEYLGLDPEEAVSEYTLEPEKYGLSELPESELTKQGCEDFLTYLAEETPSSPGASSGEASEETSAADSKSSSPDETETTPSSDPAGDPTSPESTTPSPQGSEDRGGRA